MSDAAWIVVLLVTNLITSCIIRQMTIDECYAALLKGICDSLQEDAKKGK